MRRCAPREPVVCQTDVFGRRRGRQTVAVGVAAAAAVCCCRLVGCHVEGVVVLGLEVLGRVEVVVLEGLLTDVVDRAAD